MSGVITKNPTPLYESLRSALNDPVVKAEIDKAVMEITGKVSIADILKEDVVAMEEK